MSRLRALALLAAAATGLALTVPATAEATTSLFTVTQNVLPGLANATDLGPAAASTPMHLVVSVSRPDVAGEKALLAAEHDPASPSYRQFLTPAQFAARFGVPASQRAAVTDYLTGGGLSLDAVSVAGDEYSVHGTAAQVASVFNTSFHNYRYNGTTFLANTSAPISPAGLGITNVIGLNTLQRYRLPAKATAQQGTCLLSTLRRRHHPERPVERVRPAEQLHRCRAAGGHLRRGPDRRRHLRPARVRKPLLASAGAGNGRPPGR